MEPLLAWISCSKAYQLWLWALAFVRFQKARSSEAATKRQIRSLNRSTAEDLPQPVHLISNWFLLLILTILLASCAPSEPPPARAVAGVPSERTPSGRKAATRRQLAPLCPTPLSGDELEWAAQFVEKNRSKGVVRITGRLVRMHRETKICRGT